MRSHILYVILFFLVIEVFKRKRKTSIYHALYALYRSSHRNFTKEAKNYLTKNLNILSLFWLVASLMYKFKNQQCNYVTQNFTVYL